MALEDYRGEMETCCRCSACKFIPLENVKGYDRVNVCPSISRYNFHAYSGGGRLGIGVAMLEKEIGLSDKLLEVVYNCQMCGACDTSCKYAMDMDVLEPLYAIRMECVRNGRTLPALDELIEGLRARGAMVNGAESRRGAWSDGLAVKDVAREKAAVVYHAGCRTGFDTDRWPAARATVTLLQKAGVDIGIFGDKETCCGGRAYAMGYFDDFLAQAKRHSGMFSASGVKALVTGCAECYHAFKVLYDKYNLKGELEVLHTSQYLARLLREGKLKPDRRLDLKVTYHDPCHLGRLGEPYIHWEGKQVPGHARVFDPPRTFRRGTYGVYDEPRYVLSQIPGVRLVEMERTREYAWCCGAGGGVVKSNPEFAAWTGNERIREAAATGAGTLVTACPGCADVFTKSISDVGVNIKLFDLVELLNEAVS